MRPILSPFPSPACTDPLPLPLPGGGGGGYRGGAAPRPFADSTDTVTGSGAGGSSGGDDPSLFRIIQQSQRSGLPAQVVVTLSTFGAPCEAAVEPAEEGEGGDEGEGEPDTTETKVETTTVEETKYVETVFTPDATVTQAPKSTVTVTATPETVPETEYEVSKVTLCVFSFLFFPHFASRPSDTDRLSTPVAPLKPSLKRSTAASRLPQPRQFALRLCAVSSSHHYLSLVLTPILL